MKHFFLCIICLVFLLSCKKYLDKSPDKHLVIPSSASDLQAILDESYRINVIQVGAGEASADDYYLSYADWSGLTTQGLRNMHIWESELYYNLTSNDWSKTYDVIYLCNLVLEHAEKIDKSIDTDGWNCAVGGAYFTRAYKYFSAARLWSKTYDPSTSGTDLGLPLRLISDFNIKSHRSNVEDTYAQIIKDAKRSIPFLPITAKHVLRPNRAAAYALLARVYLAMRDYTNAGLYADSSLQLKKELLNYNDFNPNLNFPFTIYNKEILYHAVTGPPSVIAASRAKIDSVLINSYGVNDLRKDLFYRRNGDGSYAFKGSYDESGNFFSGLTTDEAFMIRAECRARQNNLNGALEDLNTVMITRWRTNTFVPFTAATASQALDIILRERRKEFVMRDLRWSDIKRLNKENRNIRPKRILNNIVYELTPNELRYALPIPMTIIDMSGMPQNPR